MFARDGQIIQVPGYEVAVVDTIGSGDNFAAAFLHKRLQGKSLEDCCRFGNQIGALTATRLGGMPKLTAADFDLIGEPADPDLRA